MGQNRISTDQILTPREVAQLLKLHKSTVRKLGASGALPGFKIGKSWRFFEREVLKLLGNAK